MSELFAKGVGRRRSALLVLALVALLGAASPLAAQEVEGDPATERDRLEALEQEVTELRAEIERLKRASPQAGEPAPEDGRLAELERRIDVLAEEIEKLTLGEAAAQADRGEFGLGPAASKVYRTGEGLSVGGYGELLYEGFDSARDDGARSGRTDRFDLLRGVLYFGYKWNDRWLLNSEIEYEHASTGEGGEVSVEFAYVDYLWRPALGLRAGLLLVPMGFLNELHEPTVFLGARRPSVENALIPTTWRENGLGVFGDAGAVTYRAYVVNGLDATGFAAGGLRGGRQKGAQAKAEDFALVGRLDWRPVPGLLLGGSAYLGDSGQGLRGPRGGLGVGTRIVEAHAEWRWQGLELRGLAARAELDEVAELNAALGLTGDRSVGEELEGWYAQAGYDLFSRWGRGEQSLTPYVRWEELDTQAAVPAGFRASPANDVETLTLGVAYQPIDALILKVDHQDVDNGAGTGVDQLNVLLGYIF
ncbi:MAG TPA: hypothetical protein VF121_15445 [Thermoanaerobaculia bacterium]|nr:hypothetical protein [Thermoanaerobaculia bacterium]